MPNLKDIQRRIRTVEKTQQITSAMRMVAAAKLRRAQDAIIALRPYAQKMYQTIHEVGRRHMDGQHPLLQHREEQGCVELVLVTSDRGLCGSFNHGVIKAADQTIADLDQAWDRVLVTPVRAGASVSCDSDNASRGAFCNAKVTWKIGG